jgi:hypothetical protein
MKTLFAGLIVTLMATVSTVAGPFDGVWVTDPEACDWFEQEGQIALFNHDFLALTLEDGIVANEFGCEFLDSQPTKDGRAIVFTAFCEYPGDPFPDLISLSEFQENSINVSSLHRVTEQVSMGAENPRGIDIYTRCDNLKELPRD